MARASKQVGAEPAAKRSAIWIQGLACGALLTFAAPTALVVGVLLLPALACVLGERGPDQGMARAVALCCLATALRPVWQLWMAGHTVAAAADILSNPFTLVLAWGAGASAWASCQVLPVIIRTAWDLREATRARTIAAELTACRAEWDLDPEQKGR